MKHLFFLNLSMIVFIYCISCNADRKHIINTRTTEVVEPACDHQGNLSLLEAENIETLGADIRQLPTEVEKYPNGLPILESNPNASVALYLDFDGGTYYGYDTYYKSADLDGDASSFNQDESDRIYTAYLHVVKNFESFDVNVTTNEVAAKQARKWAWVIISDDYDLYGGKAKVGIFNVFDFNYGRPEKATALAGAQAVLNPRAYEIGYLLAHELGHNFGLLHSGKMEEGLFVEYSEYGASSLGAFMGGRNDTFSTYEWKTLVTEDGEIQNPVEIIKGITDSYLDEGAGVCSDDSECKVGLICLSSVDTTTNSIELFGDEQKMCRKITIDTDTDTNTGENTDTNTGENTDTNTGENIDTDTGSNTDTNTGSNTGTNTDSNTNVNSDDLTGCKVPL